MHNFKLHNFSYLFFELTKLHNVHFCLEKSQILIICLCGLFTFLLTVVPTLLATVVTVFKSSVISVIYGMQAFKQVCNAL
jgi:hypothetical protein